MARAAPDGGHVVWHRSRHDGLGMHVTSVRDAGMGEIGSNRARTGHATVQYRWLVGGCGATGSEATPPCCHRNVQRTFSTVAPRNASGMHVKLSSGTSCRATQRHSMARRRRQEVAMGRTNVVHIHLAAVAPIRMWCSTPPRTDQRAAEGGAMMMQWTGMTKVVTTVL